MKNPKGTKKIAVRRARLEDVPEIHRCQLAAYEGLPEIALCTVRMLELQLATFPEGQFVATWRKRIVGYCASLIVLLDEDSPWYSYGEITGGGTFSTHDPTGDTLYGADIAVHPEFRRQGVSGKLYQARKRVLKRYNLRRMVAGGRIPGYEGHAGKLTAEEYVEKVIQGELKDPALNSHLKAGYKVRSVHMGYVRDVQSLNYATFLEMENPEFRSERRRIAAAPMKRPVRRIRVCAVQYQMRRISTWEEFEQQVDFFVQTAEEYHCHFLLFPELFTVQLFSLMESGLSDVEAIARLADMKDRYQEMFVRLANRSGLFIIGGSHPVRDEQGIRNVAHLFTPSGNIYTQDKLHITPTERHDYGIRPGNGIYVFDTSHARIGIQVCYDIEFPEVARLMTIAGAEVIFVPFSTDERKAYMRVRYTGHARAVENVIYVVLAGNVGNLPQVDNFLINYGKAIICTPSDFAFPPDAIAAKADSTSETVVISDLDLSSLEQAREVGSVRPFRDRRPDLYRLESISPVQVIRAT